MISWDVHPKWVQKMLDCLSMTPPPGYSAVTLNQCMRADKELFLLLAREVVPPFKVDSLGVSPLDSKFQALMYDVRLQQYLLHMQKPTAALVTAVDDCPADPPPGKGKGKGKPKGKAKAKVRTRRTVPEELKTVHVSN